MQRSGAFQKGARWSWSGGYVADVNLHQTEQGDYIEIVVEPHSNPVNYKGEYHYRSGSTKQELKGSALDKFLLKKQGKHWDSVPVPNVAIEDLSLIALQRFRSEAAQSGRVDEDVLNDDTKHLLQDLQLINDISGHLKRAAILLFHPKPTKFVTGAYIKIGFFNGDDDVLAFQDEIHGSLMEQIDKAFDLLKSKYIVYAISYEGVSRREKPTFPIAALRESLLNAIAHKDYASGVPIQISVYPDRIVFWNSGQLP
ncbi:MAG TPA: transcriptional regulator, partial [Paludibacter sp.]|nr:transcriptional regulator [Paludibacter sp.]